MFSEASHLVKGSSPHVFDHLRPSGTAAAMWSADFTGLLDVQVMAGVNTLIAMADLSSWSKSFIYLIDC